MQKTAQKRSLLSKLREMTNVGGIAAEKFFHPEFQELMDRLRNDTDDPIRAIVSGQKIGEAESPDGVGLKDLLKTARSNLNRREYMKAIADLSRFHKKVESVVNILSSFKSNIDAIHEKFLFQDLDDESKQHLHEMKSRFAHRSDELVKEAGLLDLLINLRTERGRALAAWEKRYPKQVNKLKKDTENLMKKSEHILVVVLSSLKEMATSRATRKVDNYILSGEKIAKTYRNYDAEFRKYYTDNIKGFLEKQELIAPIKPVEKPQELGKQEVDAVPTTQQQAPIQEAFSPLAEHLQRSSLPGENVEQVAPFPLVREPITTKEEVPPTLDNDPTTVSTIPAPPPIMTPQIPSAPPNTYQQIQQPGAIPGLKQKPPPADLQDSVPTLRSAGIPPKPAHQKFFASLETMSSEHPAMLAAHIAKYAQDIRNDDLQTSDQLLQLVKLIKSE